MESEAMNRALIVDWLEWVQRACRWIMVGPSVQTPQGFRQERLAKLLKEGRQLTLQIEKIRQEAK